MTILECIKEVLSDNRHGLTAKEIHALIVERNLYTFGAEHPVAVVNSDIRRRCLGLDFPTAYPEKLFEIVGYDGKKLQIVTATGQQGHNSGPARDTISGQKLS